MPVLLTDATEGWAALKKWDWSFFEDEGEGGCGGVEVLVTQAGGKKASAKLADYVRAVRGSGGSGNGPPPDGYLRGWEFEKDVPSMLDDFAVPPLFGADWFEVGSAFLLPCLPPHQPAKDAAVGAYRSDAGCFWHGWGGGAQLAAVTGTLQSRVPLGFHRRSGSGHADARRPDAHARVA
eukprot:COSAG01_NODE_25251_length_751_cov_0.713190_2_plen_178_part_01